MRISRTFGARLSTNGGGRSACANRQSRNEHHPQRRFRAKGRTPQIRRARGRNWPGCRRRQRRIHKQARGICGGARHELPGPAPVGKRRWYATIFSFDRPRSRSISTERRGRSLSGAGSTPRLSSPWPLPCRPLIFTRASSVFIPVVPSHFSRQCCAVYDNTHRPYGVPLDFDRNASAGLGSRRPGRYPSSMPIRTRNDRSRRKAAVRDRDRGRCNWGKPAFLRSHFNSGDARGCHAGSLPTASTVMKPARRAELWPLSGRACRSPR